MPRTFGDDKIEKKKQLKESIVAKLGNLEESKKRCRGKFLSLEVVFYLSRQNQDGSPKDIDNMLKILFDTLPDFMDKNHTELGIGLIEGDSDHAIFEVHCTKKLVNGPEQEGVDISIYEWTGEHRLARSEAFAKDKHRNQLRKDRKSEYWHHLERVVANARELGLEDDEDIICAAWLHDTIEDTTTDFDDIEENFGLEVAQIVAALTKNKRLPEERREQEYSVQLQSAPWKAQVIKLCDIWANLADLDSGYKVEGEKVNQVRKKLRYFDAIKIGLVQNSSRIAHLDKGIDGINSIISRYDGVGPISLT